MARAFLGSIVCLFALTASGAETVVTLNQFTFTIDGETGCILSIAHPQLGEVVKAPAGAAGLLDVAYPVQGFLPLRLAGRFSVAQIKKGKNEVTIIWDHLGPSRPNVALPKGHVYAEMRLRAADDGKSVILTSRVENHSESLIAQILFPDFWGVVPFDGVLGTKLKVGAKESEPFKEPARDQASAGWYAEGLPNILGATEENQNVFPQVDIRGIGRALTVSVRRQDRPVTGRIFCEFKDLSPTTLRLMWEDQTVLKPDEHWESPEFLLTPVAAADTTPKLEGVFWEKLNGLDMAFDKCTGNVRAMTNPATATISYATPEEARCVSVSVGLPDKKKAEFSSQNVPASIKRTKDGLKIVWKELLPLAPGTPGIQDLGPISAEVMIRAADDARSTIAECSITNGSSAVIEHVRFPDFAGVRSFHGREETEIRFANKSVLKPFARKELALYEPGGGYYHVALRWMDLGSHRGGLCMFHRKWQTDDRPCLAHEAMDDKERIQLAWRHSPNIKPESRWDSGQVWLTPHPGGWAKGIEPFREYVRSVNPPRPLPKQVEEDIGLQTIWPIQGVETDPQQASCKFTDLPKIAEDARAHGIRELCIWGWCDYFRLPFPVRHEMGTKEEFLAGVRKARELGVNVTAEISIHYLRNSGLYGIEPDQSSWTYHYELMPYVEPYYMKKPFPNLFWVVGWIPMQNVKWQQDVVAELTDWLNLGVTSIGWDQMDMYKPDDTKFLLEFRDRARRVDPNATFQAESLHNLELESALSDYMWNWGGNYDGTPLTSVLPIPRRTIVLDDDPLGAKKGFCENLYINFMPRRPDQPNGTALIGEKPELSAAVKQAAKLRKQFLPYFTKGTPLGDSFLIERPVTFVRGYQYGNELLIPLVNDTGKRKHFILQSDLDLWLPSSKCYTVSTYNSSGSLITTETFTGSRNGVTPVLGPEELAVLKIEAQVPKKQAK